MRIVVVNTAASSGGALSILKDFYEYIKENEKKHEWIFIISDNYIQETKNIKVIVNKNIKSSWIKRLSWEFFSGSKFINNLKPDVVFSMQNTISRGIKAPKMIYLHQSIPFQNIKKFSFFKKEEFRLAIYQYIIGSLIKNSIKRSDKTIVQTQWIKDAVEKCVPQSNIIKIFPKITEIKEIVEDEYPKKNIFFYPSSIALYKNHYCLIEATKKLVKEGINNFEVILTLNDSDVDKLNITQDIKNNIKLIGYISRDEVLNIYRKSILVFPSYIETVGLPLLEARMVGSIVLASNCDFSKEVLYGYKNVGYFDPFSSDELAEHMKKIIKGNIKYTYHNSKIINDKEGWKPLIKELEEIL